MHLASEVSGVLTKGQVGSRPSCGLALAEAPLVLPAVLGISALPLSLRQKWSTLLAATARSVNFQSLVLELLCRLLDHAGNLGLSEFC